MLVCAFIYIHILSMRADKAQGSLQIGADLPEYSLLADGINETSLELLLITQNRFKLNG